ncbi:hypothetical protein [Streptomyces sp. NPDC017940]|uniref:hypothetical protein n=1 Tax=Streptomyces sp. NPDC017940 TaxID=3365017 RepID=UPI003787B875
MELRTLRYFVAVGFLGDSTDAGAIRLADAYRRRHPHVEVRKGLTAVPLTDMPPWPAGDTDPLIRSFAEIAVAAYGN